MIDRKNELSAFFLSALSYSRQRRKDKHASPGYVKSMVIEETWLQTAGRKNTKEREKIFSIGLGKCSNNVKKNKEVY